MTVRAPDSFAIRLNRWLYGVTRHWLRATLLLVGLYVSLPIAAPVLMKVGAREPAYAIYGLYSPLCHQFAFRSWFLFGEQPAYPRASAKIGGLKPIEDYKTDLLAGTKFPAETNLSEWSAPLLEASRMFIGNERMGYKVALCERDVPIYGALFVAGLIYTLPVVRRQLRPVPLWLYIFLGILPIAIDGGVQLFSAAPLALFPARETTPFFRTLTGTLFGLMNGWLAFPYMDESFRITAREIREKFAERNIPLEKP